jgi:hypothetical protein
MAQQESVDNTLCTRVASAGVLNLHVLVFHIGVQCLQLTYCSSRKCVANRVNT